MPLPPHPSFTSKNEVNVGPRRRKSCHVSHRAAFPGQELAEVAGEWIHTPRISMEPLRQRFRSSESLSLKSGSRSNKPRLVSLHPTAHDQSVDTRTAPRISTFRTAIDSTPFPSRQPTLSSYELFKRDQLTLPVMREFGCPCMEKSEAAPTTATSKPDCNQRPITSLARDDSRSKIAQFLPVMIPSPTSHSKKFRSRSHSDLRRKPHRVWWTLPDDFCSIAGYSVRSPSVTEFSEAPDLKAMKWRIVLLTTYCLLHYLLISWGFWDSPIFQATSSPLTGEKLMYINRNQTQETNVRMENFISLLHPHIDSHPHIHKPLGQMMQGCLGMAAAEWAVLLWLSSSTHSSRKEVFGLLVATELFISSTGTYFGGLGFKAVLFPDIWGFLFHKLETNFLKSVCDKDIPSKYLPNHIGLATQLIKCHVKIPLKIMSIPTRCLASFALMLVYIMDLLGLIISIASAVKFMRLRHATYPLLFLLTLLVIGHRFLSGIPYPDSNDQHWIKNKTRSSTPSQSLKPVYLTKYIKTNDGTEIAADIYLPAETVDSMLSNIDAPDLQSYYRSKLELPNLSTTKNSSKRIPTLLISTRYNRRMTVRWPFTMLSLWRHPRGVSTVNVWSWQFIETLVPNDYAVVVADTRGTGASFGTRPVDFSTAEIADVPQIYDWITKQFWFDGHVAAGGFSYDGMTGLLLASQVPVDAVLALFTPIDVVHDLIQPGGLVCSSFVDDYYGLTAAFERRGTPASHLIVDFAYDWQLILGFLLTFGVTAPVKGRECAWPNAVASHQNNWNMSAVVEDLHFSDDFIIIPGLNQTSEKLSVSQFGINEPIVDRITQTEAAVYIVGGYCDSSSVRGTARLFEALSSKGSAKKKHELIIGAWTHTGRRNCSPYSTGSFPKFEEDMYLDILRFLDCHLKKECWQEQSLPVHFWSIGEERWLASHSFPPSSVEEKDLHFTSKPYQQPEKKGFWQVTTGRSNLPRKAFSHLHRLADMPWRIISNYSFLRWSYIFGGTPFTFRSLVKDTIRKPTNSYFLFDSAQLLQSNPTSAEDSHFIHYEVDYNASTKGLSRWVIAKHPFRMPASSIREFQPTASSRYSRPALELSIGDFVNLPFWSPSIEPATGDLLLFTTSILSEGLRVVGSPLLRFSIDLIEEFNERSRKLSSEFFEEKPSLKVNQLEFSPALEVTVFAYLEDVDHETQTAHYVTEGRTLLSHRPTIAQPIGEGLKDWQGCAVAPSAFPDSNDVTLRQKSRIGSADVVYQSGDQKSHKFSEGGVECIVFTFEPIAWYFKPGHSLRLSLAGADRANFAWSRTQIKEDADFLTRALLSKVGSTNRLRELQARPLKVERPKKWKLLVNATHLGASLRLPILSDNSDLKDILFM